jgi:hypothetical protein
MVRSRIQLLLLLVVCLAGCQGGGGVTPADQGTAGPDQGAAALSREAVLEACVRSSACGVKAYPRLGDCLGAYLDLHAKQGLRPIHDAIYRCVNAAAADCAAIAACFRRGDTCDKSFVARCEGKLAVSCDLIDRRVYKLDCGLAGLKCALKTGATFTASCTRGTCDPASFRERCEGAVLLSCASGVIEVRDCATQGLTCGDAILGSGQLAFDCQGTLEKQCDPSFRGTCWDLRATVCIHNRLHYDHCDRHSYIKTGCRDGACVPAGSQCQPGDLNRCSGSTLEACLDGSWKAFDCGKLGLGPCRPGTAPAGANCSPR